MAWKKRQHLHSANAMRSRWTLIEPRFDQSAIISGTSGVTYLGKLGLRSLTVRVTGQ